MEGLKSQIHKQVLLHLFSELLLQSIGMSVCSENSSFNTVPKHTYKYVCIFRSQDIHKPIKNYTRHLIHWLAKFHTANPRFTRPINKKIFICK